MTVTPQRRSTNPGRLQNHKRTRTFATQVTTMGTKTRRDLTLAYSSWGGVKHIIRITNCTEKFWTKQRLSTHIFRMESPRTEAETIRPTECDITPHGRASSVILVEAKNPALAAAAFHCQPQPQ